MDTWIEACKLHEGVGSILFRWFENAYRIRLASNYLRTTQAIVDTTVYFDTLCLKL